jgi:hypothetical protein
MIIQMSLYAGFPAALNGVAAARAVFAEATDSDPEVIANCRPAQRIVAAP